MLLATAAFLLLARAPGAQALLPIVDTLYLLLPVLTACFVAGWAAGGPASLAVVWVILTAVLFIPASSSGSASYHDLTRAWGLFVAAAFGVLGVAGTKGPLLRRAFAAVGLAFVGAVVFAGSAAFSLAALGRVFAGEFAARNAGTAATFANWMPVVSARFPAAGDWAAAKSAAMGEASAALAAPLVPALLVLEAVAACALAWALYHRLSRTRLGAPLLGLRFFTFGHAPGWALVAGGLLLLLPALRASDLGLAGANAVVLSGTLFALRGAGVAAWFLPVRRTAAQIAAWGVGLALAPVTVPVALGLGLTDSWLDWRGLGRAPSPAASAPTHD